MAFSIYMNKIISLGHTLCIKYNGKYVKLNFDNVLLDTTKRKCRVVSSPWNIWSLCINRKTHFLYHFSPCMLYKKSHQFVEHGRNNNVLFYELNLYAFRRYQQCLRHVIYKHETVCKYWIIFKNIYFLKIQRSIYIYTYIYPNRKSSSE